MPEVAEEETKHSAHTSIRRLFHIVHRRQLPTKNLKHGCPEPMTYPSTWKKGPVKVPAHSAIFLNIYCFLYTFSIAEK